MSELESNLTQTGSDSTTLNPYPEYLYAADNHNLASGAFSITDPSTWGEGLDNAGKFIVDSAVSGVDSIYNTGASVANFFGSDVAKIDVASQLMDYDENLGKYYQEHKESTDLAGFVLTSFVPSIAGIKLLNVGQAALRSASATGFIGSNLKWATGLLAPDTEQLMAKAAAEFSQSELAFSVMTSGVVKSLAGGVTQGVLEGTAATLATYATMYQSPILSEQDGWDIAKNVFAGGFVGGTLGGVFSGARTFGKIKQSIISSDKEVMPWKYTSGFTETMTPAERIIISAHDLKNMPEVPLPENNPLAQRISNVAANTKAQINTRIREELQVMADKDPELANIVADQLQGLSADQITANMLHSTELGRMSTTLTTEKLLNTFEKTYANVEGVAGVTPSVKIGFVKLFGEDGGSLSFEAPSITRVADTAASKAEIDAAVKSYKFSDNKIWDATKVTNSMEADAYYHWIGTKDFESLVKSKVGEYDIPKLEQLFAKAPRDGAPFKVSLEAADGTSYEIKSLDDLFKHIQQVKIESANKLIWTKDPETGLGLDKDKIASIINVRRSYLDGEITDNLTSDIFARQSQQEAYTKNMIAKGLWNSGKGEIDLFYKPSILKVGYDIKPTVNEDGFVIEGMAHIKEKYTLYQQTIDNVFAKATGELSARFWHPTDDMLRSANRIGAGPGLFKMADSSYGSIAAWAETTGASTNALLKAVRGTSDDLLQPVAYRLVNNEAAAREFSAINQKISATYEKYVLNSEGDTLIPRALKEYQDKIAAGGKNLTQPQLQQGAPLSIAIENIETREAIAAHIERNGQRVQSFKELRAAQGLEDNKNINTFYPIRPNPKDFPHFVFVVDPTVTGAGHVSMLHAATSKDLEQMVAKVKALPNVKYEVITKNQSELWHKAMGDFEYERTLHENYIDASMRSRGINSPFFAQTDPAKIVKDLLDSHARADAVYARELVNAKYEKEFAELRRLGESYTDIASSKYGGSYKQIEDTVNNPYINVIKTALDLSQVSEHPLWMGFNNLLDQTVSKAVRTLENSFNVSKSPADLEVINEQMTKYGMRPAYYDAATNLLANHSAPRGALTAFVRKANAILANTIINTDVFNAINNSIGDNVLLGAETRALVRGIKASDPAIAGKLANIMQSELPGVGDKITAPGKLIVNAIKAFSNIKKTPELEAYFRANNWMRTPTQVYQSILEDLTLQGSETAAKLDAKISSAFTKAKQLGTTAVDLGKKWSGNNLAEDYTRFVAAHVAKQITDLGVEAGVISEPEARAYINTFVNRTRGNIIASQRPIAFQGAVGQAVGLFQTFQFNTMQQLFRYVGEGQIKDAAMMMGLQGTFYGLNGLPAFNALNTHIIGTMSGNQKHVDGYSAAYGILGSQLGDLLLYGMPSNLLRANMYTRGDINPRQLTIIPTNPVDIPFINVTLEVYKDIKQTVKNVTNGGAVWESILQGIEHTHLSRPLAGFAQTLQSSVGDGKVFSTSNKGDIMSANDLFTLATLVRLGGARPLNEAIANDAVYRFAYYQATDAAKKDTLTRAIKTTMMDGANPTPEQVLGFAHNYALSGGKVSQFNKYMLGVMQKANTSQANAIADALHNPFSQSMQKIMGGDRLQDGIDRVIPTGFE